MPADDSPQRTRPDARTREEERADAEVTAGADRAPTPEESEAAEGHEIDDSVREHEREMAERGVAQKGEGRIP